MGFKSMASYNGEKYGNWFRLQNDGDYADVIFLYRGTQDVMMADTHYIRSDTYSGYVTCCGKGCPACAQGVRIQPKLFVPMFVLRTTDASGIVEKIQFWDRTLRFQPQLLNDVFRGYPDPSGFVFRITRHGVARDINTTYDIRAIEQNTNPNYSYDAICSRFGATFPDYYNLVCKDVDMFELGAMLTATTPPTSGGYGSGNNQGYGNYGGGGNYGAVPRGGAPAAGGVPNPGMIPGTQIPYSAPQGGAPNLSMPNVSLNTPVPESPPDPGEDPFGGAPAPGPVPGPAPQTGGAAKPVDPDETDEDIDMTDLKF